MELLTVVVILAGGARCANGAASIAVTTTLAPMSLGAAWTTRLG